MTKIANALSLAIDLDHSIIAAWLKHRGAELPPPSPSRSRYEQVHNTSDSRGFPETGKLKRRIANNVAAREESQRGGSFCSPKRLRMSNQRAGSRGQKTTGAGGDKPCRERAWYDKRGQQPSEASGAVHGGEGGRHKVATWYRDPETNRVVMVTNSDWGR